MQSTRQTSSAGSEAHVTITKEGVQVSIHTLDGENGTNSGLNALATSASAKAATTATITGTADIRFKSPA